jgi:predicted flap endonuclease-1-like 5' DNA nuclease
VKAGKTNDKEWVEKFDLLYVDMIKAYNNWRNLKTSQLNEQDMETSFQESNLEGKNAIDLTRIKGIGQSAQERLRDVGITTIARLAGFSAEELSKIKGFSITTARKIIEEAKQFLKGKNQKPEIDSDSELPASDNNDSLYGNSGAKITDFTDINPLDETSVKLIAGENIDTVVKKEILLFDKSYNQPSVEELIVDNFILPELETEGNIFPPVMLAKESDIISQESNGINEKHNKNIINNSESELHDNLHVKKDNQDLEIGELKKNSNQNSYYKEGYFFHPKFKIDRSSKSIPSSKKSIHNSQAIFSEEEHSEPEVESDIPPPVIPSVEINNNYHKNNGTKEEIAIEPQPEIHQEMILDFNNADISNQEVINRFLNEDCTVSKSVPEIHDIKAMTGIENDFQDEISDRNRINAIRRLIEENFKSSGYFVIPRTFSLFKMINKYIDLLAVKVLAGSDDTEHIFIIPAKICDLKGTLLVSDDKLDYHPVKKDPQLKHKMKAILLEPGIENLIKAVNLIFRDITQEGSLFKFFAKYLKEGISVEKSKNNRNLFFRSGLLQYMLLIEPILICQSEPASLEKSLPFPYQKRQNIHYAHYENLPELVKFLEKKYELIETHSVQKNTVKTYFNAVSNFNSDLRNYSVPFALFGGVFLLIMLTQAAYLINLFVKLGYAAIGIYAAVLFYIYLKLYKKKAEISEEFNSPYHLKEVKMDETDLVIIKEELSTGLLDQFIYECFGKTPNFKLISKIEEEKARISALNFSRKNELDTNIRDEYFIDPIHNHIDNTITMKESANKSQKQRDKKISKYSSFLED